MHVQEYTTREERYAFYQLWIAAKLAVRKRARHIAPHRRMRSRYYAPRGNGLQCATASQRFAIAV